MRKLATTISALMVAAAMVFAPVAEAQGRARQSTPSAQRGNGSNRGGSSRGPGASNGNRPGSNGNGNRPSNPGGNHRPGTGNRPSNPGGSNRPSNPGNNNRPSNPGNNGGSHRPGNGNRPGNTNPPMNRPGNGNHNRPGNNGHYPGNNRPGQRPPQHPPRPGRPDYGYRPPRPGRPPHGLPPRPMGPGYRHPVPFFGHWHRPVPPPRWHYTAGVGPVFSTILGVAIGATIASSLNSLAANGYTVSNYGSDVVYLSNVPQMNLIWPDAAMYYNNGLLCGSQFTYPTSYYDMSRYNTLYNRFVQLYGAPVSTGNSGGIVSATWFGGDNRFVTIEFNGSYGNYYTTLSYGM